MQQAAVAQADAGCAPSSLGRRLAEAEVIYRQVLAQAPDHPAALHLLGTIAQQVNHHDVAIELIRRAISILPGDAAYHCNLGNSLLSVGKTRRKRRRSFPARSNSSPGSPRHISISAMRSRRFESLTMRPPLIPTPSNARRLFTRLQQPGNRPERTGQAR